MYKLTQRDKRVLVLGAICGIAIVAYRFGPGVHDRWRKAKESLAKLNNQLSVIDVNDSSEGGLASIVPVFETPADEETQKFAFRSKFFDQLKKAGIKSKGLKFGAPSKSRKAKNPPYDKEGYRTLTLRCTATCNFQQVLTLLATLNENPYLVGVEEFKIDMDPKKPQEVKLDLTVSTFIK